jgi:Kef-type K+ transport system membrane component KefB
VPQGGILEHGNPSHYDQKNPIVMFIIQAGIIIIFCRILHWPLKRIRQPRVIAEVIGGILLGPSVMGRIPGFTMAIFPTAAMPNLNLVANIGLVLFLFLVGLEVDFRYLVSNWKIALSVGLVGMALPFGLGCAIAWGIYNEFKNEPGTVPISFGVFMLFIGVAMAITAFPVLCRILVELKLLHTPVGVIVLSAGVGNDVVGMFRLFSSSHNVHSSLVHRMDIARPLCRSCQLGHWTHCTLGLADMSWLDFVHGLCCQACLLVDFA